MCCCSCDLCLVDFWTGNTKWITWGKIPSWLVIWGLINDAKLFQNLGLCLLLDRFKVVSFFLCYCFKCAPQMINQRCLCVQLNSETPIRKRFLLLATLSGL